MSIRRAKLLKQFDDEIASRIKPLDFKPCVKRGKFRPGYRMPDRNLKDLRKIARLYGLRIHFGGNDPEGVPVMIPRDKLIEIQIKDFDLNENVRIFCHELAHWLQYLTYKRNKFKINLNSLVEHLAEERQAERVAYRIHKTYFPHIQKVYPSHFCACKSKEEKIFLKEWHGARNDTGEELTTR